MNRKLITSALPYVNNIPHLGNLIQMLSGDVFARFCRSRGYDTLYICGTDEYGTATETRAIEEKKTPRELCDYYYNEHVKIYDWFHIDFDKFGRTSNVECAEITKNLFLNLDRNGYIKEHAIKQLYCPNCKMFLADRYVDGTCPKCSSEGARGDQCDKCGSLLDPTELINPKCHTCGSTPLVKETKHLYIDLPSISKNLDSWMEKTSKEGRWSDNSINITKAWIRDGLNERAITRDLKWGIPVPKEGYEDKVFYVWFNAPIGYMSITKQLANELLKEGKKTFDWKSWWLPEESKEGKNLPPVELFQFIGKDNIPFHTVIFPCTLLGSGHNYTKLFHMSSTEYLNYEDGKFSKSLGVGVFGTDAIESGIPSDAWRFYIFYNRPEKQDFQFTWKDFMEKMNSELIGNLGNLVNRTVLFVQKYYDSKIPQGMRDDDLWLKVIRLEDQITDYLEWANLKDAFHLCFEISDICNKKFQETEPWKTRTTEPEKAANLLFNLCYVIKDLMIMMNPYMPVYTQKVMSWFGKSIQESKVGFPVKEGLNWSDLGKTSGLNEIGESEIIFKPMDQKTMLSFREKFNGKQNKNKTTENQGKSQKKSKKEPSVLPPEEQCDFFNKNIELKVAKILKIENNPEAEKLYIETLDDGSGKERIIQSGLREFLKPEELIGKNVIIVSNLQPRKIRGVESRGMLLAASFKDGEKECVEVLQAPWAKPGDKVVLEGKESSSLEKNEISGDEFFKVQIKAKNHNVQIAGINLSVSGTNLKIEKASEAEIG